MNTEYLALYIKSILNQNNNQIVVPKSEIEKYQDYIILEEELDEFVVFSLISQDDYHRLSSGRKDTLN